MLGTVVVDENLITANIQKTYSSDSKAPANSNKHLILLEGKDYYKR